MLNVTRLGMNPAQINKESESIDQSGLMIHVCRIYINIYSEYNEKGHEYTVGLYNRAEWCHLLFAYVCRTHFGSNSASLLFERERDRRKRGVLEALLLWRPAWGWLYPSGLILVLYLWACALPPRRPAFSNIQPHHCSALPTEGKSDPPFWRTTWFTHSPRSECWIQ